MKKETPARRLEPRSFAEQAGRLTGEDPLAAYPRLTAETQGRVAPGPVTWTATGELRNPRHVNPEIWLHLQAHAVLPLVCQRCLGEVEIPVDVDRSFRFVADETTALAQDDEAEEDLLVLAPLDVVELVEDELLMEMPVVPRHETCPAPVKLAVADPDFDAPAERENPFAVLQKLGLGKPK
ncbi:MAG: DUF177 domain-containing protein [Burkholderiales bacterium]|nr:DUF177 domain-containing protein [Burkholderiales bacterium]